MKHTQAGLTLIELLITLLISSTLIAGIAQVFVQSNESFRKQQTLSYMAEDGRYIMEMLGQEFRRVGYLFNRYLDKHKPTNIFIADLNAADSGIDLLEREHIRGEFNADGFNNKHDVNHIVFRYQLNPGGVCDNDIHLTKADCQNEGANWTTDPNNADEGNSPCSGQVPDVNEGDPAKGTADIKTISLYVDDEDGVPTLYCKAESNRKNGAIVNNNGSTDFNGKAIPLISNVEKIWVLYGVDTDASVDPDVPGDHNANRYVRADQVADEQWVRVVSARIYLVMRSEEKNVSKTGMSTYQIDDIDFNVVKPGDNRLYRVFSTTLAFRN